MSWKDEIRNPDCELCPLHEGADHVCLMGSGKSTSNIMIIGEAPGAREDESHRAFVGPAGKVLTSVLDQIDIKREDCYITNVAKCRPPENRTPELKEIKACVQSYLVDEFEMVKPGYVLLLGNSALRGVVGKSGITKHNGTVWEIEVAAGHTAQVMATLHPAAILRNPKWTETFAADMIRFSNLIQGIDTSPKTRIKLVLTAKHLKWFIKEFTGAKEISWDVETDTEDAPEGFTRGPGQDWHGEESLITSIACAKEEGVSYTFPIMHPKAPWKDADDVLDAIRPVMTQQGTKYIAHNGKFDAIWMHSKGIPVRQHFDTMLAAHMIDENKLKGLKSLSKTKLAAEAYDVGEDVKNTKRMPIKKLCRYNARDADYTLRLYHIFKEQLKQEPRSARIFQFLMMPASNALVDIERRGVAIDMERWEERYIVAQENRDKLYKYINQFVPEELQPINLRSPPQVAKWLFGEDGLGFEPIELSKKTKKPSTKESVLLRLFAEHDHKALTALMKYRKWEKYVNTYLGPWRYEWMDSDHRIHSRYKLYGTVTGRLSGEGGIQQVPRDPFIRSIVGARPGWKLLSADFSQVELRIAAMLANEKTMLRQFHMGEDIHMIRAMKMSGITDPKKVPKETRKKAKAVNFGYIYSMGAKKFVSYAFDNYELKITLEEAHEDREQFFEDYSGLRPWHKRQRNLARKYHRVVSPLGRTRHLPDILSGDEGIRAEAERQAINSPVQSTASDLMLSALVELNAKMDPKECCIVFTVHDELGFECREDKLDEYGPYIKETMEDMDRIQRKFGCDITVPIVAEVEYGDHWGEPTHELTDDGWKEL